MLHQIQDFFGEGGGGGIKLNPKQVVSSLDSGPFYSLWYSFAIPRVRYRPRDGVIPEDRNPRGIAIANNGVSWKMTYRKE